MLNQRYEIGRAIYEDDFVSAKATDLVVAQVPDENRVRGWVTTRTQDGWRVDFYAPEADGFFSHYRVAFPHPPRQGRVTVLDPPERLDATRSAMVRARRLAERARFPRCDRPYNVVVLPAQLLGRTGFIVYMLAAHAMHDEVVVGGHARIHVSEDGNRLLEVFPLSKGCMVMPPPRSFKVESIVVTTLVADTPLETHVFLSYLHQKPVIVMVPRTEQLFVVDPLGILKEKRGD